ncbi:hypothetical protein MTR_6g033640 [Medicago truncatula]|uniref:Uncharacterized protein n=1 Tax=Medicago truncatula TaxID=3880 RepID=A0A072UIS0_MEDTR|nr:hypothetical protein MTR_6g033640 [Medicago truncatula]
MNEVVKKGSAETFRWRNDISYSNSLWVRPVQVVPKNGGICLKDVYDVLKEMCKNKFDVESEKMSFHGIEVDQDKTKVIKKLQKEFS